jgi:O-antigen ligase
MLGGSAQGIWANMVLQLVGLGLIAWAAAGQAEGLPRPARQLLMLLIFALVVVALQLIPLPAELWSTLGPRDGLADGFAVLGMRSPPEPLSLSPAAGLNSLLGIIVPLAMFCTIVPLKAYRPQWLAVALITGALAGIALGAAQVASSQSGAARWYLYDQTNWGRAVGFFANADHMASLLVIAVPFLAGLVASVRTGNLQRRSAAIAIAAGVGLVLVVGLVLNRSLAGYGLGLGVIGASSLIMLRRANPIRVWTAAAAAVVLIGGVAILETTAVGGGRIGEHAANAVGSRAELFWTTARAAIDFLPYGSGLGTFQSVYPLYENTAQVTTTYAVHAHNDYVELFLELGVAGALLILLFMCWWATRVWRVWGSAEARPYAKAAAIASGAMLLHSLVDFPLRTAAIAACFGMCMALLADRPVQRGSEPGQLRQTRHMII